MAPAAELSPIEKLKEILESIEEAPEALQKAAAVQKMIPPEHLTNSWPLLKKHRAMYAGLLTAAACAALVFALLVSLWFAYGVQGVFLSVFGSEALFLAFHVWRYSRLNARPASEEPPGHDGWATFNKFLELSAMKMDDGSQMDVRDYVEVWFRGAKFEDVKSENMMDLLAYGFWYKTREQMTREDLGDVPRKMLIMMEEALEVKFPEGRNPDVKFMAHLWEDLRSVYRPFAFYILTEFAGILAHRILIETGFVKAKHAGYDYFTFAGDNDVVKNILKSRGRLPAQSPRRKMSVMGNPLPDAKPIVFLHGVGLGVLPYLDFISALACTGHPVIVVEYRHVAMRLCTYVPSCDEVAASVVSILDRAGVQDAVFVGHSYGTFVLSRIVKAYPNRVHSACFIDPVCLGMFLPRLLSTFVYLPARTDSLSAFLRDAMRMAVSRELGITASMCRKFAWSELNLWPKDLPPNRSLVVFSGRDVLVPSEEVEKTLQAFCTSKIMYHPKLSHGEFLMLPDWKLNIIDEIVSLAVADFMKSEEEARAEKLVRKQSLIVSVGAFNDLGNPVIKQIEKNLGSSLQRTLSIPWEP